MNRILVVNVNWLGDVVFSSPVFYALRKAYPKAYIACMGDPRVHSILKRIDVIDEIITYDESGCHRSFFAKWRLARLLRSKNFDIAFLLHGSVTKAFITYLAGVRIRVGYQKKKRQIFLTNVIQPLGSVQEVHRSDLYLNIIEGYSVAVDDRANRLQLTVSDGEAINSLLDTEGITCDDYLVVLNCGANWGQKKWPAKYFSELINGLKNKEWKVVVTGASSDVSLVEGILSHVHHKTCINLTGRTTLDQLIVLLSRANIFVCADSGPLHIANSLKTSVVGLFGPTRPELTAPRGSGKKIIVQHDVGCNAQACYHESCSDNICMKAISVYQVIDTVNKIYNEDNG
ncbi:MAG: lipopolysaccharide heptosyltransferase II [Candidatus Omnitrophota bacterium]|jgi:lipopolysaccharide heptosyltransferase II